MKTIMLTFISIFFINYSLYVGAASKYVPRASTVEEINLLPEFCKHKNALFKTEAGIARGKAALKSGWLHMHHYCDGLNSLNHAKRTSYRNKIEKKDWLNNAEGQMNYMLKHTDENYFYRPQFFYYMAIIKTMKGDKEQAIVFYQKAIDFNKEYIPAYKGLSRLYKKMGNKEMAIQVIQEGLENVPDSKILKKKLKRLTKK